MTVASLDNLTNVNGFGDMITFLNQVTGNMFMPMFVISFSVIMIFILRKTSTTVNSLWVSAAISTLLCFIFMMANFMNYYFFVVYLIITVIITGVRYMELG
jgi:hypothetical protein